MRVMIFEKPGKDLSLREMDLPEPGAEQVLLRVHACAVCRTDLHVIDGELSDPKTPLVPGHEIVGTVAAVGAAVMRFKIGDRLGVPWLGWTCGECSFCREGQENLCDRAKFTGYTLDGGYADYPHGRYSYHARSRPGPFFTRSSKSDERRVVPSGNSLIRVI